MTLDERLASSEPGTETVDLLALDQALERLGELNERWLRLVELRYFGGLTVKEAAKTLGVAEITVKKQWALARGWLARELSAA